MTVKVNYDNDNVINCNTNRNCPTEWTRVRLYEINSYRLTFIDIYLGGTAMNLNIRMHLWSSVTSIKAYKTYTFTGLIHAKIIIYTNIIKW